MAAALLALAGSVSPAVAQTVSAPLAYKPAGGLTLSDAAGANSITLHGLGSFDAGVFSGGTPHIPDRGDVRDGILNLTGTIASHWHFQFAYDFADRNEPPRTPYKNVTVSYDFGEAPFILAVGNQKVPFSQQHLNVIPQLVFAERALPFALAPRRRLGVAAGANGARWQVLGGVYATNINDDFDIDDRAYAARATWGPELGPETVLHLGLGYEHDAPHGTTVAFGFPPETILPDRALVASGPLMEASRVDKINLEIGGKRGPLTIQSEFHVVSVEARPGGASFEAGYVQAAYLLTGESRPYIVANGPMLRGVFGRPKVADPVNFGNPFGSGTGAVELAARLSASDLRDRGIGGGREWEATLGVNWFLNDVLRLTANYIHTETDEARSPNEEVDALLLRTEVRF